MKLMEVFTDVPDVTFTGPVDVQVNGIRYDSRRVQDGDLFAAIRGENFDGARFIPDAVVRGARVFLAEKGTSTVEGCTLVQTSRVRHALALASRNFFGDPSSRISVVGITGTNGKTTTSYLVHGICESSGIRAGLIGTVQYLVGGQVISAARTTPESPDLNSHLSAMIDAGVKACIMEVSSHALTLERTTGLRMAVAAFTNLTREHLDFHRDMEDYYCAKSRLSMEGDVGGRVVNLDDAFGRRLTEEIGAGVLTYGLKGGDIHPAGKLAFGEWGSRCTLSTPWGKVPIDSPLPGRFNLSNIMTAVGVCGLLGLAPAQIAEGILKVQRVPGRFERVDRGQPFSALVDYAHTPDALENLLQNVREITTGKVLTVFGCGGDRDRTKRPLMGAVAARLSDLVFVTSDNPRSEDPECIIDEIMDAFERVPDHVSRISDRRSAISAAVIRCSPGDTLVVAGKGHENYQMIGGRVIPFSDVDEVAAAIERLARGEL